FDDDGLLDIARTVNDGDGRLRVLLGSGTDLDDASGFTGFIAAARVDTDTAVDLVASAWTPHGTRMAVLSGDGTGKLVETWAFETQNSGKIAVGDLDLDGDPEAVVRTTETLD